MRVLEFVCVYWNLYACIAICMRVLEFVCVYWNLYACIGIYMRVLEFVCVYWNLYACLYLWATEGHRTQRSFEIFLCCILLCFATVASEFF